MCKVYWFSRCSKKNIYDLLRGHSKVLNEGYSLTVNNKNKI